MSTLRRSRWFVLPLVALASCGHASSARDASAPDASESPPADVCTLDMHTCVASPPGTYCWYLDMHVVDETRHCLALHALERCEPGRAIGDAWVRCYHTRPDGGVAQTVVTPDSRYDPGFTPCTEDERTAAFRLPLCP